MINYRNMNAWWNELVKYLSGIQIYNTLLQFLKTSFVSGLACIQRCQKNLYCEVLRKIWRTPTKSSIINAKLMQIYEMYIDIWNVCLQTYRNKWISQKIVYSLRKIQTSQVNNSRILRIKIAKLLGYCFYVNPNI